MSARELMERAALWSRAPSRRRRDRDAPPPADAPKALPEAGRQVYFSERRSAAEPVADGWNLWELERRARVHAGADAVPEEWAAMFRELRGFANSDGRLPVRFDSLVRESFPELTRAG